MKELREGVHTVDLVDSEGHWWGRMSREEFEFAKADASILRRAVALAYQEADHADH